MDPKPLFPAHHQTPLPEIRQVAGHRGLRQTQSRMQMADADLAVHQQVQQPYPYRIGERLEQFDASIQRIGSLLLYPHSRIYKARLQMSTGPSDRAGLTAFVGFLFRRYANPFISSATTNRWRRAGQRQGPGCTAGGVGWYTDPWPDVLRLPDW